MNKRMTFFILLSVIILFGSNYLLVKNNPQKQSAPESSPTAAVEPPNPDITKNTLKKEVIEPPAEMVNGEIENSKLSIRTTSLGARIESIEVKGYTNQGTEGEIPVDLIGPSPKPEFFGLEGSVNGQALQLNRANWNMQKPDGRSLRFSLTPKPGIHIIKEIVLEPDQYVGKVDLKIRNETSQPLEIDYLKMNWGPGSAEGHSRFNVKQIAVFQQGKIQWFKPKKKKNETVLPISQGWVGMRDQYFGVIFYGKDNTFTQTEIVQNADQSLDFRIDLPVKIIPANSEQNYQFNYFFGPQRYNLLKKIGFNLVKIINFGMFGFIAIPMLYLLKFFFSITKNYGFAIILLTIVIRAILWWPTQKSYSSMKKMQTAMNKMQPRLKTLKEVYKDNPTKLNEETMKLYKEYQINPMGGCLPMLLQMPIFFALYSTLSSAVELKGASFIWIWQDLSTKDPFYVLPIAMGLSMFFQQKISTPPAATTEAAAQQKMMLYLMPAMLTFFSFMWPSGLLLYWVVSNILSIGQQVIINRKA